MPWDIKRAGDGLADHGRQTAARIDPPCRAGLPGRDTLVGPGRRHHLLGADVRSRLYFRPWRRGGVRQGHPAVARGRDTDLTHARRRCAFQSRKIPRPTSLRAFATVLGEMHEAGVRHGTGDPALAFLALYRKSSVPYYSNWCFAPSYPVASTGIAKYLAPADRGLSFRFLAYSPACCS